MKLGYAAIAASLVGCLLVSTARAQPADDDSAGPRIFKAANCVACHKWSGTGGGGYGGAAANLRKTELDEATIVDTVRCGHPGGGMPYFQQDAYKTNACGLKESDLDVTTAPPAAEHFLQPQEIHAVAHYVFTHFKGKGDPTHEECVGFFGHETHLCDEYPKSGDATAADTGTSHHLVIDSAPDPNEKGGK